MSGKQLAALAAGAGLIALSLRRGQSARLGLAVPSHQGIKDKVAPFNPWDAEADKKRLARWFVDIRSGQAQSVAPKELPDHVKPFAEFMLRMRSKKLSQRDVIKAYLITVGSMRRQAIDASKVRERWPDFPRRGRVRPEDTLADLLLSPLGQTYLNQAVNGEVAPSVINEMASRFGVYGFDAGFKKQLKQAVKLGDKAEQVDRLIKKGKRKSWYTFVQKNVPGVSIAKAGFLAAMLGRGDMTTADARQINFWTCPPGSWSSEKTSCAWPASKQFDDVASVTTPEYLEILNKRMRAYKMRLPKEYEPFREHLTHHAFWDRLGNSKTTHAEVVKAMELAGL